MGLVDVFARWFLDRLNDKFFRKKDLSVERRTQLLHRFLLDLQSFYHDLDTIIKSKLGRKSMDLARLQKYKKRFKYALDENIAYLKKRIYKEHFKALRGTGRGHLGGLVEELEFFFEQKGFPQLSKQLKDHIKSTLWLHADVLETLSDLQGHIAREDIDCIVTDEEKLSLCKEQLQELSSDCKRLEKKLIDFARKLNE